MKGRRKSKKVSLFAGLWWASCAPGLTCGMPVSYRPYKYYFLLTTDERSSHDPLYAKQFTYSTDSQRMGTVCLPLPTLSGQQNFVS